MSPRSKMEPVTEMVILSHSKHDFHLLCFHGDNIFYLRKWALWFSKGKSQGMRLISSYFSFFFSFSVPYRGGSRGRVPGVRTPPPPRDDLRFSNTAGILQKTKNYVVYLKGAKNPFPTLNAFYPTYISLAHPETGTSIQEQTNHVKTCKSWHTLNENEAEISI